ncbi:MAG: glycosyltransferase [Patescibacteria group bacterium]
MITDFSKTIIIIPTYNEKDNITGLARAIFEAVPGISVLVVDDNSPDGTADAIRELAPQHSNLEILQRSGDRGFGKSYLAGFQKILADSRWQNVVMMDADFSHEPAAIPAMLENLTTCDVVIGSRYMRGGQVANWHWYRRWLSRFANFYARTILAVPAHDLTTGFMAFHKSILDKINLAKIKSDGYAFLVELKYKIAQNGFRLAELPITFNERREGQSKMSGRIIWESIWLPWQLKLQTLKAHWLAFIFAALFGLMIISPQLYHQWTLGPVWQGINRQMADDSLFYLARIREVIDGHPTLNNAYLAEYKSGWPRQIFLAEYLLAQPLKLFGLTVARGQLIYNFILPFLVFLLTYLALYLICSSRFLGLIGASFLFYGLFLFVFFRPVSPQFNFLFWLVQFILVWLVVKKSAWPWILPLSIINLGLLFYIYPYYWTFYLILFALLFWTYFWLDRHLSWRLFKISTGGLLLGSFYFYYTYLVSHLPGFEETLTRVQLVYTRFPSGIRVVAWAGVLFALILAAWRWRLVSMDAQTKFFAAGALAVIVSVNQHLLTGRNFEFSSHYYPLTVFLSVFGLVYLLCKVKGRLGKLVKLLLLLAILFPIGSSFNRYFKTAYAFDRSAQDQSYAPVLDWLNRNTEPDSVVYAGETLSQLIPVYTANNVFYSRYANLFLLTDAEIYERFIINNYFEKFDRQFILANDRAIFGVRYVDRYGHAVQGNKLRKLLGLKPEPEIYLPAAAIDQFLTLAAKLQSQPFSILTKKYQIDYFVFENDAQQLGRPKLLKVGKPVFENKNFVVYQNF